MATITINKLLDALANDILRTYADKERARQLLLKRSCFALRSKTRGCYVISGMYDLVRARLDALPALERNAATVKRLCALFNNIMNCTFVPERVLLQVANALPGEAGALLREYDPYTCVLVQLRIEHAETGAGCIVTTCVDPS